MSSQRGKWAGGVRYSSTPAQVVAPLQANPVRVELDQRRDHVVLGQDALGSRRGAKQAFAPATRWSAPGHQAA
jgi:hypothetical protein